MALDVFLSYAHQDQQLRDELATHLSNLRRQGVINEWYDGDIAPGSDIQEQLLRYLTQAPLILLLISADFLASDFCYSTQMQQALARHTTNEARVIPIILRPTDWEGAPFSHLKALPTGGKPVTSWPSHDEAFADVVKGLRLALKELGALATPAAGPSGRGASLPGQAAGPVWNVPYRRNPFFTGRDALLSHLHSQLTATQAAALTQAQAIHGLGGIGKTQTAVEYSYRYRDEYQAVLWVSAATQLALLTDVGKLATLLNLPEQHAQDQEQLVAAVKSWLLTHAGWLLILDNADDLALARDFLPKGARGHILLTTRAQAVSSLAQSVPVEELDQLEGTLLLLRRAHILETTATLERAPAADRATAEAIVQAVGGLPLALDQAGAFIEETGCALSDYLQLYQTRRRELLGLRKSLAEEHPEPVATTWSLSFQKLEDANPAASALLRLCAFLSPDSIAEELIIEGASHLGSVLGPVAADPLQWNQALEALRRYSLIKRQASTKTLSMHRLVQAVLRDAMSQEEQPTWAERAIRAVAEVFPNPELETWARCARYLPQAQACAELLKQYHLAFAEAASLLHRTGYYLREHARYTEAERYLQQALQIEQQMLPAEHPNTASTLHELGRVKLDQGRYEEAERYLQQALQIKQQVLPAAHRDTASTLHELGRARWSQGQYEEAERYYQQALQIKQQVLPAAHPSTATTLNNLGSVKMDQGQYAEAERYLQQALQIKQQVLPAAHPSTAATLHELGRVKLSQGQYKEAERYYQQALKIKQQVLPAAHPSTAATLHELGIVKHSQGRDEEAERYYQQALKICQKVLPADHPSTITTLKSYASLLRKMAREKEARDLEARFKTK